ncbi:putative kinetochore protein Nuf2 [Medicago truncatula]|uniref:Putative kinetochore protein Nuf2 n=1 Tax=Medicago truncatula TaxID=3880 RepID=A0A396GTH7_MEDTR|nr:kinetochore protein NUF2 homolog [Medicago truncatula]XP_024629130.1 kinetochore protein NUF2 homolog [Medicago truncatula]XP_024629131.1 kinetochore protein NUF2 homolog [Medicago truncatula]RHN42784.1 putative kinetochore protein Nuf2 [Medicago truncatula]
MLGFKSKLSNPKSSVVFHLYTHILNYLLPEEYDEQLEFNALEHLENPDLHVGAVPVIKLYNKIIEMLNALECPQKYSFNFADLLKPDPRRTEFFLGALLSFCIHWNEMMNSTSPIIEEINTLEDERAKIEEDRIMQLTLAIDECKEARGREMPYVQEVDAHVKELRQNIANLNNKQMSLRTDLKKLKEKTVEMDDKISDAEYRLIQSVQENANLHSKIVQSPDKVQRALEEKKLAREKARNAERLVMHNFHKKTALVEVYAKVYKKMSNHYKKVQAI